MGGPVVPGTEAVFDGVKIGAIGGQYLRFKIFDGA